MQTRTFSNGNKIIDFGITQNSVNVYVCLDKHLRRCNGVYPGDDVIAKECGITKEMVRKSIAQLKSAGFIQKRQVK